ncbi:DNA Polymerase alpha zinc finger [Cooperia oncophora]
MPPVTYDHCESLSFVCPRTGCGNHINIRKAIDNQESGLRLSLETCEKCDVELAHYIPYICNRLSISLREFVAKHLIAPFKCDDPVCEFSTRTHLLRWCREGLECPKCSGGVLRKGMFQYSAKDLFDQQMFLKQVVDVQTALDELKPEQRRILQSKSSFPSVMSLYNELSAIITRYLDKNAYSKVDLAFIFAPMLKIE